MSKAQDLLGSIDEMIRDDIVIPHAEFALAGATALGAAGAKLVGHRRKIKKGRALMAQGYQQHPTEKHTYVHPTTGHTVSLR